MAVVVRTRAFGGRVAFERAEQRTLQQPAVSDRGALGDSHRAADPIEESYDRSCQEGGHSFLVEHLDDLGRQYERSLLRRHRGVTSGAPDRDSDRAESLFGRSYEGCRTLDSSQPGGDDDAAFVIDGVESNALFFEIAGDLQGALRAAGLLVESEGDPHVPLRAESLRKQRVGRFEDREQHAFHVERAASVDPSVGYGAGEGRVVPARKGCIGSRRVVIEYGNHVVVGTEQDRRQGRVLAGPAEYQPVFVDRQGIQPTVNRGICLRQIGFEGLERIVVRPVDRIAYGRNPDSAGQPFDGLGGRFDAPGRPVRTGGADEGIGRGADYHYGAEYEERHGGDARQEPDHFLFFFHGSGILGRSDRSVYVQLICHTEIFSNLFSPLQGLPEAFFGGGILSGKSGWESEIFSISLYR